MALPELFSNLTSPIPNNPFYYPETWYVQGPYSPLIVGTGLAVSREGVITATAAQPPVTSIIAGPGIYVSSNIGDVVITNIGVRKIIGGTNITITPGDGTGIVQIDSTAGTGTVTSISAGSGLTGGVITTSGTLALDPSAILSPSLLVGKGYLVASNAASSPIGFGPPGPDGTLLIACSACSAGFDWLPLSSVTIPSMAPAILGSGYGYVCNTSDSTSFGYQSLAAFATTPSGVCNTALGVRAANDLAAGSNNVAIGTDALTTESSGVHNTAVGAGALCCQFAACYNTAIGSGAGKCIATGSENTVVGSNAFPFDTYSNYNVAVGSNTLGSISGFHNTALGYNSMCSVAGGGTWGYNVAVGGCTMASLDNANVYNNTVVGYCAGFAMTTAWNNTYVGRSAGGANTNGCANTAVGSAVLFNMTTGACNVAFGYSAGCTLTIGSRNVLLGSFAGCTLTTGDCNNIIGFQATSSSASATGETTIQSGGTIARFSDSGPGASWAFSSDVRLKKDIEDHPLGLAFVKEIQPRVYSWLSSGKRGSGFVAQELDAVVSKYNAEEFAGIVNKDDPDMYLVAQAQLIPILVNAIKELAAEVEQLKNK